MNNDGPGLSIFSALVQDTTRQKSDDETAADKERCLT